MRYVFCLLLVSFNCNVFSQDVKDSTVFSVQAGTTLHTLNESGKWHHTSVGYTIGVGYERFFTGNLSLRTMLNYLYRPYDNYINQTYDPQLERTIILNTSFVQHEMILPVVVRYNKSIFYVGAGASFSYLFKAVLSETSLGGVPNYIGKYDFHNKQTTAPFSRINIAPLLNVGINASSRLELGYMISYELIADPQQYVFNQYRFLNQNLFLAFKFNKP